MRRAWLVVGVFGLLAAGCYEEEPLEVANGVQLERLEGRWYEIAKLPRHAERDCSHTTVTYNPRSSDEFRMLTECESPTSKHGILRAEARLVLPDRAEPAKLALDFGFYQGEHWIIDFGTDPETDHEYVVVGHPTRQFLWILSREHSLGEQTLANIIERARQQRFPTEDLEYTEQD